MIGSIRKNPVRLIQSLRYMKSRSFGILHRRYAFDVDSNFGSNFGNEYIFIQCHHKGTNPYDEYLTDHGIVHNMHRNHNVHDHISFIDNPNDALDKEYGHVKYCTFYNHGECACSSLLKCIYSIETLRNEEDVKYLEEDAKKKEKKERERREKEQRRIEIEKLKTGPQVECALAGAGDNNGGKKGDDDDDNEKILLMILKNKKSFDL
jgi:hypothetical protein